jgi:hypothetical protein
MGVVDDELDRVDRAWTYSKRPLVRFSAIGEAWGLVLERWPLWALTVVLVLIAHSALSGVVFSVFGIRHGHRPWPFWIGLRAGLAVHFVVSTVLIGFFLGGMYRMACQQLRGRSVDIGTFFSVLDVFPQLLLGSVLYALAIYTGLCLLVVPGFIVAGVLMFTLPLIVDGGLDATDALGQSWRALKGQWLVAALFHAVAIFVAWVGLWFCVVGFLFTAPLYCMAIAVLYREFFMMK